MTEPPDAIERIEREEFARGHVPADAEPVAARPAATVVLARESDAGLEALLLRRPDTSRFAAGAYVFPGGVIDAGDRDPGMVERLAGTGVGEEGAALAAGIRELFEETGILLADPPAPPPAARAAAREALLADRRTLGDVAADLGLRFEALRVAYFSRWITPERLARRYDTRFFLASHPGGEPELTGEHTAFLWSRPEAGLAGFHRGELPMLFPTWKTLETLAAFGELEEALAALGPGRVEPIQARLIVEGDRIRPVMPGDEGYERGR